MKKWWSLWNIKRKI